MKYYVACARALLSLTLVVGELAAADLELPDGKGKEAVESTCTECHDVQRIREQHFNEEGWNGVLREMTEKGASINPDDIKAIVDYLTLNFGPNSGTKINVNKASAKKIAAVLQLTSGEAAGVVEYRAKNGDFKNLSDLEKVTGLASKIDAKKELIEF